MAYFEWADDLAIDHGPIDDDHKHLVALVNALHTATSQGCGQEVVGDILKDLAAYTKDHLQREEQIMVSIRFPKLEGHKKGHEKFVHDLEALQHKYEQGSITTASQLSTLLRDWLSLHIRRSDREIRDFLKASR
ncbi:MAG TPA: bacteriohemerythrin [Aquabacterium sp.]|uniref:bacteriohemerythrin n=1 Tax=Aquabacterium sp. TaxID=1872578 RepID=UPI002E35EF7D|nr:bacteriohemerythrin [Aquabacterium sp.]HEX5372998.1 bacteriohemerythrin [Aquabacterium sp.]